MTAATQRIPFVLCDVFAERPLAGNQLAVFPEAERIPEELLRKLTRETNFSEAAFLYPPEQGGDARIRIFEPDHETPFAGHPVLGSAVVWATSRGRSSVTLETGRGKVPVELLDRDERGGRGRMEQPIPHVSPFAAAQQLLDVLTLRESALAVEVYDNGTQHVFVTLTSADAVRALTPDLRALAELARSVGIPFLGINCVAGLGLRWKTRMFAPAAGINEDPATGSAAGPLSYHLVRHAVIASGTEITVEQGAEIGRPSILHAVTDLRDGRPRIRVSGRVFVVGSGAFELAVTDFSLKETRLA